MKSDWLAASGFERTHEVVSAINTLSIDAKLRRAGVRQPFAPDEVRQARGRLLDFLDTCRRLVEGAAGRSSAVVGDDPRLGHLAMRLFDTDVPARRGAREPTRPLRLAACGMTFAELKQVLQSERDEELASALPCLRRLRALLEEEAHGDVDSILGEV